MPSRRDQISMTPDEMRAFLRSRIGLVLVTNGPDGFPQPLPMSYMLGDDDKIYCGSFRKTQKVTNLKRNPKASLLIEAGRTYGQLRGVMVEATVEILEDPQFVFDTMVTMRKMQTQEDEEFVDQSKIRDIAPKRVILRFTPTSFATWDHTKLGGRY